MAEDLNADPAGLRLGAASSESVAADLLNGQRAEGPSGGEQPSHAGVQAVDEVMRLVRLRQSRRISDQSADVAVAAARYDGIDEGAAGEIAVTM